MKMKSILLILLFVLGMSSTPGSVANTGDYTQPAIEVQQASTPVLDFRGLAYGPFRGVGPDQAETATRSNIIEDMKLLQELGVNQIRTYGVGLNLFEIPGIAADYGIETATGTWISSRNTNNYGEIDTALLFEDDSSMVIIGNEVLTGNQGFSEAELIDFVNYAKDNRANSSFPVATAEEWVHFAKTNTTTFELQATPIGNAVDIIIMHAHPVWHDIALETAANWTVEQWKSVQELYPNKTVILGETGWPSESSPANDLFTPENQKVFYDDLLALIDQYNISSYLFEAFDENWKGESYKGQFDIGPYWGVMEERRYGKPAAVSVANYFSGSVSTTPPPTYDPTINTPSDKQVDIGANSTINWIISDADSASGTYSVYRNGFLQGVKDLIWTSGYPINWLIDSSIAGQFEYKIVFSDGSDFQGEDIVIVTVGEVSSEGGLLGENLNFLLMTSALLIVAIRFRKDLESRSNF